MQSLYFLATLGSGPAVVAANALGMPLLQRCKAAIVQMTAVNDVAANFAACAAHVREAQDRGCAIVFLPENFSFMGSRPGEAQTVAEPLDVHASPAADHAPLLGAAHAAAGALANVLQHANLEPLWTTEAERLAYLVSIDADERARLLGLPERLLLLPDSEQPDEATAPWPADMAAGRKGSVS